MMLPFITLLVASATSWDASLEMHALETTQKFNARCLDGSPGA